MGEPIQPAPDKYDRRDQQEMRNLLERRDLSALKTDTAIDRLLMLNSTGEPGLLTIVAGVPTWTAL